MDCGCRKVEDANRPRDVPAKGLLKCAPPGVQPNGPEKKGCGLMELAREYALRVLTHLLEPIFRAFRVVRGALSQHQDEEGR